MPFLLSRRQITKDNFITGFQCWLSSILSFVVIKSILEMIISKISGISFLGTLREITGRNYSTGFHFVNMILFSMEMAVVVIFYMFIRNTLSGKYHAWLITTVFFLLLTTFFLCQLINLGIYPLKSAVITTVSNMISFPFSVFMISVIYSNQVNK